MLLKNTTNRFYLIICLLFTAGNIFADSNASARFAAKGDKQFIKSHLAKALNFYQQSIQQDSTNAYAYFQTGAIYYLSDSSRVKSLPYFLKTLKFAGKGQNDTIIDAYYYIGNCYILEHRYAAAAAAFSKYMAHIDQKSTTNETILDEVKHNLTLCAIAPYIANRESDSSGYFIDGKLHPVYVKNEGGTLNSPYPEYSQLLMNHGSTIVFTSRRPASQKGKKDFMTDQYYEDIFVSHKDSGHWSPPVPFADQLHFKSGEVNLASVTVTSDGNTMYIYHHGKTLQSHLGSDNKWSKPEKINKNWGNVDRYIPSVFVSSDGKKMFLVTDREGGYGGKDIYLSQKDSSGKWAIPQNLGPEINTPYDEDSPFLMPDNKTLFFSSTGHNGLGGYDMYKTVYENGKWSSPVNLGSPINSSGDDIYMSYDTATKMGYFSSSRINSGFGDMDIYSFGFVCDDIKSTILQGIVAAPAGQNMSGGTLVLTDNKSNKAYTTQTDAAGKFSLSLVPERTYNAVFTLPGFTPFNTTITTPHQCNVYNLYQSITPTYTDSANTHVGQKLVVKNGFYRYSKPDGGTEVSSDPALSGLIKSSGDTDKIWEKDTTINVAYTPTQRNMVNPKPVDTTHMVTGPKIPSKPTIYFAFNKSTIEPKYFSMLDSIAAVMKTNSKYKIQIEGNTDTVGSAKYNQALSLRRAKSVEHYLTSKGLPVTKIHIVGNGKRHLAIPKDGANALNRRDDIIIIE